ncbi:C2 calcium-dependent domain-containing protein 4A-like [Ctenodactylus gundi]
MWCLERLLRCRDGLPLGRARRARTRSPAACAQVLTPARIPEFCIPPRLAPRLDLAALGSPCGEAAEPELWPRTDGDPRSQAALSLPHLPRARTAYGFCALLESPHTRRKESLLLGDLAPRPRARAARGAGPGAGAAPGGGTAPPAAPAPSPRRRRRRLLRAPDGLLGRALRARRPRRPARARSVSSGDGDDERPERPEAVSGTNEAKQVLSPRWDRPPGDPRSRPAALTGAESRAGARGLGGRTRCSWLPR